MNRIYRVIWSKARNCYVVVSELAKQEGKSSTVSNCVSSLAAVLAVIVLTAGAGTVQADGVVQYDNPEQTSLTFQGTKGTALKNVSDLLLYYKGKEYSFKTAMIIPGDQTGIGSMALGHRSSAAGLSSVAFGEMAKADGHGAVALGESAQANTAGSTAVGNSSAAKTQAGTALGYYAIVNEKSDFSTALGANAQVTGKYTTAVGYFSKAVGDNAVVVGSASSLQGENGTALGSQTKVTAANSVALGFGSVADRENTVSVGSDTAGRIIANVAAGDKDTDAVNVAQLKAAATYTAGDGIRIEENVISANVGITYDETNNSLHWGKNTEATKSNATAWGSNTKAAGSNATAFGYKTEANGGYATAWGSGARANGWASTAWGMNTLAKGSYATAWGNQSVAAGYAATALGLNSQAYGRNSFAALGGIVGTENEFDRTTNSAAIGQGATVLVKDTLALGSGSVADRDIKDYTKDAAFSPVTRDIDVPTWKATQNAIAIGDAKNGVTRQLTGLAAGSEDTDAVNVAQLKAVQHNLQGVTGDLQDTIQTHTDDIKRIDHNTALIKRTDDNLTIIGDAVAIRQSSQYAKGGLFVRGIDEYGRQYVPTQFLEDGSAKIGKVSISSVGKITGVANGEAAADAVNKGQLDSAIANVTAGSIQWDDATTKDTINGVGLKDGNITADSVTAKEGNFESLKVNGNDVATQAYVNNTVEKVTGDVNDLKGTVETNTRDIATNKATIGDVTKYKDAGINDADGNTVTNVVDATLANKQSITAVAQTVGDGTLDSGATDLTNGINQNYAAIQQNNQAIGALSGAVNQLDTRVKRVGAGAAALAALHPLDYDPANKWDFAAGYGNYRGANAVAIGTFYRSSENTMFSFGGSFGGGENMINAGVSFKIGTGSGQVSTSRTAIANELTSLRDTVQAQSRENQAQAKEIEELKALVQQLVERKA